MPTILLVEDEDMLRGLIRELLQSKGYNVYVASCGEEALEVSAAEKTIDLLLTDVMMPNMSGSELMEKIRENRPDLKVLFMSGYTGGSNANIHESLEQQGVSFLQKPFRLHTLLDQVKSILGTSPAINDA